MNKYIAAHEFGHSLACYLMDPTHYPTVIYLRPDEEDTIFAWAEYDVRTKNHGPPPSTKFSKLKNLIDLGGIFGEALFIGPPHRIHPWGARIDIDSFLTANRCSRTKLIKSLYKWQWVDEYGFAETSKITQLKKRQDHMAPLPLTVMPIFDEFTSYINREEFVKIVDELTVSRHTKISSKRLGSLIKRCLI